MEPALLTALITAGGAAFAVVLGAIGVFVGQSRAHRLQLLAFEAQRKRDEAILDGLDKNHKATNSMKDQLVEVVTAASLKKGFREALDVVTAQLAAGIPIDKISQSAQLAAAGDRYDAEAAHNKQVNQASAATAAAATPAPASAAVVVESAASVLVVKDGEKK